MEHLATQTAGAIILMGIASLDAFVAALGLGILLNQWPRVVLGVGVTAGLCLVAVAAAAQSQAGLALNPLVGLAKMAGGIAGALIAIRLRD
jgi:hypothetical protein